MANFTKEEIINAPNSLLYYKAICENCGCVFETRLRNKGFMCKRCKCSLSQKEMYKQEKCLTFVSNWYKISKLSKMLL